MPTEKNRYIVFKIINSDGKPIQMNNDSFLNMLKDRLYKKYGIFSLWNFDRVYVTLFLVHEQIIIFKVPRNMKKNIVESLGIFGDICGRKIRFESKMTKSSIRRLKEYLKSQYKKEEIIQ